MATDTLSISDMVKYAEEAGFKGSSLVYIVSIAEAESSGNRFALADYPHGSANGGPEISAGLTQVNTLAHPEYTVTQLYDPLTNFKAAYQISNGGSNFNAWSTWTNGHAQKYYDVVQSALMNLGIAQSGGPTVDTSVSNPGLASTAKEPTGADCVPPTDKTDIAGLLNYFICQAQKDIVAGAIKVGWLLLGIVLIIAGIYLYSQSGKGAIKIVLPKSSKTKTTGSIVQDTTEAA